MNIIVKIVPLSEQPCLTQGDWRIDSDGNLSITIVPCQKWQYEVGILIHEIVEWAICMAKYGKDVVVSKEFMEKCDAIDALYEKGYADKTIPLYKEPGYDKRAPYHLGHVWGDRISWIVLWLLGIRWKDYCRDTEQLVDDYVAQTQKK